MGRFDPSDLRRIFGHYPTGVCAVTGIQPDGVPAAMIVGSFTSVSLDPPLIAFFPDKSSSSWSKIATCSGFCVNVLGARHENLCRVLASKKPDKFDRVPHSPAPGGAPIIEGALAWFDCANHAIHEAGDHLIVLGRITALAAGGEEAPLLFHKGSYGKVTPIDLEG